VLRDGTKVSLLIRSHHPAPSEYLVQRTVPNPPVVRTSAGGTSDLRPADIVPGTEVYGQHEISEIAKSPEKLTRLLDRFVIPDAGAASRKTALRADLERSRTRILEVQRDLATVDEELAALPALEERLTRFREAGVEEQLRDRSLLVTEEQALKTASDRLEPFAAVARDLRRKLPIDLAFLSAEALRSLPAADTLAPLGPVLERLGTDVEAAASAIEDALRRTADGINAVSTAFGQRRSNCQ
jgi:hypothetical protein